MPDELDDHIDALTKHVTKAISEIDREFLRYQREAISFRRWDLFWRSLGAVMAVAAPALVAYEAALPAAVEPFAGFWRILIIFLVGFAGASVTLQAILGFGHRFANAQLTAAKLLEIKSMAEADLVTSTLTSRPERYNLLRIRWEKMAKDRRDAVTGYVREEVNAILPSTDRTGKTSPPPPSLPPSA